MSKKKSKGRLAKYEKQSNVLEFKPKEAPVDEREDSVVAGREDGSYYDDDYLENESYRPRKGFDVDAFLEESRAKIEERAKEEGAKALEEEDRRAWERVEELRAEGRFDEAEELEQKRLVGDFGPSEEALSASDVAQYYDDYEGGYVDELTVALPEAEDEDSDDLESGLSGKRERGRKRKGSRKGKEENSQGEQKRSVLFATRQAKEARAKAAARAKAEETPEERQKRKRKEKRMNAKVRRRRLIITAVIVAMLVGVGFGLRNIINLKIEQRALQDEQEELIQKKKELVEEMAHVQDKDYIERQAREQLHMIKPGEILYIIPKEKKK